MATTSSVTCPRPRPALAGPGRARGQLRHPTLAVLALLLAGSAAAPLSADVILQTYGDTLTTYKPSGASAIGDVRPLHLQRGVGLDGLLRAGSGWGWALAGNPFGDAVPSTSRLGDVNLMTGAYCPTAIDLALPAPGGSGVVIGRSFNGLQETTAPAHRDSNGPQGYNWSQLAMPELVLYDDVDNTKDVIYLVYGADRYHNAGLGGSGASSYIDDVILRDKDANTAWTSAADGTLEERRYSCQNWRHDASVLLTDTGKLIESVKYSAYGVPFGLPAGDVDADGDWDSTDSAAITGAYDVAEDTDLDGDNDAADVTWANTITGTYQALGRTVLSSTAVKSRKGYAGYEHVTALAGAKAHIRHRFYNAELGRWNQRDPMGYVDGMDVYEYVASSAIVGTDPSGQAMTVAFCDFCVDYCLAKNPQAKRTAKLCSISRSSISCSSPCLPGNAGETGCTTAGEPTIRICAPAIPSNCTTVCWILTHEMVHYCDYKKRNACTQGLRCYDRACTEIRSAALSGECCGPARWPGEPYLACVRRRARGSTGGACNPDLVDQVWARCLPPATEFPPCAGPGSGTTPVTCIPAFPAGSAPLTGAGGCAAEFRD